MPMTKLPLKKSPLNLMILSFVSGHLYAETAVEPGNVQQLNTIVISAEQNANPQQEYQKELAQVSGGTNFIGEQQLEQQRLATTADVFRLQPGIYAQSAGNEGAKISIRVSGINRTSGAQETGMYVLIYVLQFHG